MTFSSRIRTLLATTGAVATSVMSLASAHAATVLTDDFNSDTHKLNWTGDAVFTSSNAGGHAATDLIGAGFFDIYPGHGNYVDLDGSMGSGNKPAGLLESNASFGPGTYLLTFNLGGNKRGTPAQTTVVSLGDFTAPGLTLASSAPMTLYSYTFTTTTAGKLFFTELGPSDQRGNVLDDVTLVSLVPEPGTWAFAIGGFGLLGLTLRRRRRQSAVAAA